MRESGAHFEKLRHRMVDAQIAARGIRDPRVLAAMRSVPRHLFVPESQRRQAYSDQPLPIGFGQTISQPYIVALMSELCGLTGRERVLEIGTGSGYQSAVLCLLAREVYSVEIVEALHRRSSAVLEELGFSNVHTVHGNGYLGLPAAAPFDAILLTAAPPDIPLPLLSQLDPTAAALVAPEGAGLAQNLIRIVQIDGRRRREAVCGVRFVPMVSGC